MQRRRFSEAADTRVFPRGKVEVVELDDIVVGRMTYEPGWRWSTDVKPVAGTDRCMYHHVGITLQGRLRAEMSDGTELEIGPGDVFEIPPGHDAWVVGDSPWVSVDFEAMRSYGRSEERERDRVIAAILMTDIVDSTAIAVGMGDRRWREVVARHNELVERLVDRHRGHVVKTTGDGILARFESATDAALAAVGIAAAVGDLGVAVRAGIHTGQVEVLGGDVRGVAVHAAARVMAVAGPGEVVVSAATRDLVTSSDLEFEDAGLHVLKGIDGARQLFRVRRASAPSAR
jgi:class 3 adenylate cyclase